MPHGAPILVLDAARPAQAPGEAREPAFSLTVEAGDLVLIEVREPRRAALFADLCSGLVPLRTGRVRFLDQDWADMPQDLAETLRGRMGRIFGDSGWIEFLDVPTNIMLAGLHHTYEPPDALRTAAAELALRFGLPGLPLGRPADLSPADLRRAACLRAFLGRPALLLLENPVPPQDPGLLPPLLNEVEEARSRGAAAIWLTPGNLVWRDRSFPASVRLRLLDSGLVTHRWAA